MVASYAPPTGDLASNPGMCPDWESNQQPFVSQAGAQSTEPHQPGLFKLFLMLLCMSLKPQSNFMAVIFHFCDEETKSTIAKSSYLPKL